MGYFCVHAIDRPGMLAARQAVRDQHRARLRRHEHPVTVRIGGPLLDAGGDMIGTMLVIEADALEAADRFLRLDPYVLAGIFAQIRIDPFNWGLGLPESAHG